MDEAGDVTIDHLLKLFEGVYRGGVLLAEAQGAVEEVLLDVVQEGGDVVDNACEGLAFLGLIVAAGYFDGAVGQVAFA